MNWTNELIRSRPNIELKDMFIPGSHNSAAMKNYLMFYTQNKTISEQFQLGIRYFDIRLCIKNDIPVVSHTILLMPFEDVIKQLRPYLNGELVIMSIQPDSYYDDYLFISTIKTLLNKYSIKSIEVEKIVGPLSEYDFKNTIIVQYNKRGIWLDEFDPIGWINKFNNVTFDDEVFNKIDAVFTYNAKFYVLMTALIIMITIVFYKVKYFNKIIQLYVVILLVLTLMTLCNVWIFSPIMHGIINDIIIPKMKNGIISYDYINENLTHRIIQLNFKISVS